VINQSKHGQDENKSRRAKQFRRCIAVNHSVILKPMHVIQFLSTRMFMFNNISTKAYTFIQHTSM
jgi:hypothetical protein